MKKHIVCFGDSNTHGYCADPSDCNTGKNRFDESERWTCLLGNKLGDEYLVCEEGLSLRNTVFPDPLIDRADMCGVDTISEALWTHEPVSLLILMLGTNDCRDVFNAAPATIAFGILRIIDKAKTADVWENKSNILVVTPPHIRESVLSGPWGPWFCNGPEKSKQLAQSIKPLAQLRNCHFFDAAEAAVFNDVDGIHLTKASHVKLADALYSIVKEIA